MNAPSGPALDTIRRHTVGIGAGTVAFVSDWASPFTQRTWMALEQRQIPYVYQEATKTEKALDASKFHPNELLPYLRLNDGRTIRGSIPCIEFLEETYPTSIRLCSLDPVERARERVWTDWIRRTLIPILLRVLRANPEDRYEANTRELCRLFNILADEVRGPYFSGDVPTLPDVVIAPFILRIRQRAIERGFAAARCADGHAAKKYQTYARNLLGLDSLKSTSPDDLEHIECPSPPTRPLSSTAPRLPPELIGHILAFTRDYELACTLNFPHALPETAPWAEQATPLDRAILSGQLDELRATYERSGHRRFSKWGARCMIRFGYIHLLDYLNAVEPAQMHELCDELLPEVASAWGRVEVLEWAHRHSSFGIPANISPRAIDDASRNGHVRVLEWWLHSGISPLSYSEDALKNATIKKQIKTLEWWKASQLPLKIGNVLDFASMVKPSLVSEITEKGSNERSDTPAVATTTELLDWWNDNSHLKPTCTKMALYHLSCTGNIKLLNWWKDSKLPLVYDKEVLVGATKHGKVESLQWWLDSHLQVCYTFFDIEEAIEDSVAGREAVEAWWTKQGLRSYANAANWTKSRELSPYRSS